MNEIVTVFCDESCHLENDESQTMVMGAMYCISSFEKRISNDIKKIKLLNNYATDYEIKWTKVNKANFQLMRSLVDYFFETSELKFRCYVVDKSGLNHQNYLQNHDTFYYKILYRNLEYILNQGRRIIVYLDIKDTKSINKTRKLKEILNNYTSNKPLGTVLKIQAIQSHESQLVQLTDLFIGAARYKNEGFVTRSTKNELIDYIEKNHNVSFLSNSSYSFTKFNIFHWDRNSSREV